MKTPLLPAQPWRRAGLLLVPALALLVALAAGGCGRKIVARVNGDPIYRDEFVERVINFQQAQPGEGAGLQALSAMVNDMIVLQEARRENVVPTDQEIDARLQELAQRSGQSLDQILQATGVTLEAARIQMRNVLAQQKLMTKGIEVTDAEIQKLYDENKGRPGITTPEQFSIRQITVATEQEAKDAKSDLKGADFGLVALSRSTDIFKQQGGQVPPFTRDPPPGFPVDPAVRRVAYSLKDGQISDPIKVGNQWVIVKLEKREPAKTRTLEEMKDEIREALLLRKAQESGRFEQVQQRLISLRQQADVEILDERFKNAPVFQKQPTPSPAGPEGAPPVGPAPAGGAPPPPGGP